jgi:hypothetical protein
MVIGLVVSVLLLGYLGDGVAVSGAVLMGTAVAAWAQAGALVCALAITYVLLGATSRA